MFNDSLRNTWQTSQKLTKLKPPAHVIDLFRELVIISVMPLRTNFDLLKNIWIDDKC